MSELSRDELIAAIEPLMIHRPDASLKPMHGNNDGRVVTERGFVVADCRGHEGRAELIERLLTLSPAILAALAVSSAKTDWQAKAILLAKAVDSYFDCLNEFDGDTRRCSELGNYLLHQVVALLPSDYSTPSGDV